LLFTLLFICADAAAILLSLLKELQKESQAISQLAGISSQWCGEAAHQDQGMAQVIQGQLDDATIAVQQIKSDEKRLQSELTLARSTQQQREQQLQDATQTSNFAAAEFASERDQLNKTLEACKHSMTLVKAQMKMDAQQQEQLGSADVVVNNLLQIGGDHMTDDEKSIMSQYASDPKPAQVGATGARPQELLQTLTKLLARLEKEESNAFAAHQVMSLRLWSFTDHLSSSIMESKSQAASISMEMSQRKREHTRLTGKIASLNGLLAKVEASKQAVAASCNLDAVNKKQIENFIEEESDSVRVTLKKMPALSSELLFDLNTVLPATPKFPSFLQVRGRNKASQKSKRHNAVDPILKDLEDMAKKFPQDSASFVDAEQHLAALRAPEGNAHDGQVEKPANSINGFASSSIQDIYSFLKSDDQGAMDLGEERMLLGNSGDLKAVTGVYGSLLDGVHAKEKIMDDQLKWCGSIVRDAKVDADAVARSVKWTGAKLNLVRVAMAEYNNTKEFNAQQQQSIATRSTQLQKLADVEDGQLQQSYDTLKAYAQQLLSLVSELGQKTSAEERKGADVIRGLLEKVEKHQGLLQRWRVQANDNHQAVSAAFKVVERALAEGAKQSSRRLVHLRVESQVLTSLAASKVKDKELSENYVKLAQELCSPKKAKDLQAKGSKLREEGAVIQKSLATLTQPMV
jgi:sulfur carrier protein ThiS